MGASSLPFPHETIIDANDAFLRMVGYTREDLERGLIREGRKRGRG
jgi:PAS domain-containing protein